MWKRLLLVILVGLLFVPFNACSKKEILKDSYYYFRGEKEVFEKIFLKASTEFLVVQVKNGIDANAFSVKLMNLFTSSSRANEWPRAKAFSVPPKNSFCLGTSRGVLSKEDMEEVIREIRQMPEVKYAGPAYFVTTDRRKSPLISVDEFIVKFGKNVMKEEIDRINANFGVEIVEHVKYTESNSYILRVKNPNKISALEMANKYVECGEVQIEYAHANFTRFIMR